MEVRLNTAVAELLVDGGLEDSADFLTETNIEKDTVKAGDKSFESKSAKSGLTIPAIKGVRLADGTKLFADKVIVATGGLSYPSTGSTGDGFRFAEKTNHKVTELKPALVPFETKEACVTELQGLSLKNVKLSLINKEKCIYSEQGEMLFTHFGISGPLVLTASSKYAALKETVNPYILIDLKPALSDEEFDKRLIREFENGNRKELKNILGEIYPQKLAAIICDLAGIDKYLRCNEISAKERKALLEVTKRMKITISGTRDFNEAIITHGTWTRIPEAIICRLHSARDIWRGSIVSLFCYPEQSFEEMVRGSFRGIPV